MSTNSTPTKRPLYQKAMVVAGLMGSIAGTLTGIMTYVNVGITDTFISDWLASLAFAVLLVMPAGFLLMVLISKLVQLLAPSSKKVYQQLATGISMAFIMESLMAASTTATTMGLTDKTTFITAWGQAFITALPFGLFIAVVMSLFLKPKLEQFMAS
ncbi:DUF2798 domain-containing protein [Gilvimarinus polysaccharolyticus]|uniref:DUF2798 domain-containing protein n=1 Tax=Gilvimarinus polysaccharolyticus TaxID=863921 RepID=UPI00067370B3|nr:DUF2798 domain-containing protein [Gilvimarinus polysaccharolyticus]